MPSLSLVRLTKETRRRCGMQLGGTRTKACNGTLHGGCCFVSLATRSSFFARQLNPADLYNKLKKEVYSKGAGCLLEHDAMNFIKAGILMRETGGGYFRCVHFRLSHWYQSPISWVHRPPPVLKPLVHSMLVRSLVLL